MRHDRTPFLTSRLAGFGESVFAEMTRLAVAHQAVNLGQGFPDFDGPEFVKEAAIAAPIRAGHNQYTRSGCLRPLTRAVAGHQKRFYDLDYDAETEITTCAGATEAIFSTLTALLDPGDEVVFFEPFYDSYPAVVANAECGIKDVIRGHREGGKAGRGEAGLDGTSARYPALHPCASEATSAVKIFAFFAYPRPRNLSVRYVFP